MESSLILKIENMDNRPCSMHWYFLCLFSIWVISLVCEILHHWGFFHGLKRYNFGFCDYKLFFLSIPVESFEYKKKLFKDRLEFHQKTFIAEQIAYIERRRKRDGKSITIYNKSYLNFFLLRNVFFFLERGFFFNTKYSYSGLYIFI